MNWPITLTSGALEVRFDRRGDRIEHSVWISGIDVPLLTSVEGSSDDAWPSSPPFQELTLEERSGRSIGLLVGRAGASHWSACIEPTAEWDAISLDIACRIQQPPAWLGCRFRVSTQATARLETGTIAIICGGKSLKIAGSNEMETSTACRLATAEIEIVPNIITTRLPATARWRFTLSVAGH
jgi:hypothetical protein